MIVRRKFVIGAGAAVAATTLPAQVWVSPFDVEEGLPIGQVVFETFTRADGNRIAYTARFTILPSSFLHCSMIGAWPL
jgi:hypothetical protein